MIHVVDLARLTCAGPLAQTARSVLRHSLSAAGKPLQPVNASGALLETGHDLLEPGFTAQTPGWKSSRAFL